MGDIGNSSQYPSNSILHDCENCARREPRGSEQRWSGGKPSRAEKRGSTFHVPNFFLKISKLQTRPRHSISSFNNEGRQ